MVHESYLRLVGNGQLRLEQRGELMAYMARVMCSVIVDFVRVKSADKRGGQQQHIPLDTDLGDQLPAPDAQILHVHEALQLLAASDPCMGAIVEMHYFGGMTEPEIASVLGVSERTIRREREKVELLLEVVWN